jgi:type IV pilus assembly protein PilE
MMKNRKIGGFTLIELMIVVLIIGVIASIAIPSYNESVKKTRRVDAKSSLMSFAAALERQYSQTYSYIGADDGSDANGSIPLATVFASESPVEGATKFYDLRFVFTTLTYTVIAVPKGAQAGDGAFRLTSTNSRGWDKANDGTFSSDW